MAVRRHDGRGARGGRGRRALPREGRRRQRRGRRDSRRQGSGSTMRSRLVVRRHRRPRRQLSRDVAELTHAAAGAAATGELTKRVLAELGDHAYPSSTTVAAVVAAHCADDSQRSALAAYLYLCRDLSLGSIGKVFGVDAAAARRLVERGTGTAPVTAGDECRGWALVAPRPGRTPAERQAASGHLSLCRKCRNKLRVHAMLEQRVAAAGSVAFGASVTAAVGRAFAGSHAVGSAAGALTGPIVALSTAAALTAGAGTVAITTHRGGSGSGSERTPAGTVRPHPGGPAGGLVNTTTDVHGTPAADPRTEPTDAPAVGPTAGPAPSVPGVTPVRKLLPLPALTAVPLPTASLPPLPLPRVSLSPVAVPTKLPTNVPLPLPSVTLPLP